MKFFKKPISGIFAVITSVFMVFFGFISLAGDINWAVRGTDPHEYIYLVAGVITIFTVGYGIKRLLDAVPKKDK